MMSIPRDLKVDIPGYGNGQDQRRLRARRPAPDGQDGQEAVRDAGPAVQDQPRRQRRLRRLPQGRQLHRLRLRRHRPRLLQRQLGRRELRHDRRQPGLPEAQRPATRSTTSATATATTTSCARARQQDFLRQLRNAAGARQAARLPAPHASWRRSSPATPTPTRACAARRTSSRCSSSCSSPAASRSARSASGSTSTTTRVYLTRLAGQARQDRERVPATRRRRRSRARPRSATDADRKSRRAAARSATAPPTCPASRSRAARARTRRSSARAEPDFPFYFPTLRYQRLALRGHRAAHLRHPRRARQEAPRLPARASPRASSASTTGSRARPGASRRSSTTRRETRKVNGRKLELHYDGKRLRLVAWRTKRAVYWVSNTLTQSLSTRQMIAIAGVAAAARPEVGRARPLGWTAS